MSSIRTRAALEAVAATQNLKYLFFWGHRRPATGVAKTCFSQWYEGAFEIDGEHYATAEHYMMAEKARLFGDENSRRRILAAKTPAEAKQLGRLVQGFDNKLWEAHRYEIVVRGNIGKFSQHADMRAFLLGTGELVLVEASPEDAIWGIGLVEADPRAMHPAQWRGLNLLGFALMEVREQLLTSS